MTYQKILILFLILPASIFPVESLYLRLGYGGNWQFYTSEYTNYPFIPEKSNQIAPADVISAGGDLKFNPNHGLSASYEQGLLFAQKQLRYGSVAYKWFPFTWYNQLFVGAGFGYLTMDTTSTITEKRLAAHITYGLNIQFPANIFIIAEFKHLFNSTIENKTANTNTIYYHNLILTGSIAYRVEFTDQTSNNTVTH